jgi:hypothetical protein
MLSCLQFNWGRREVVAMGLWSTVLVKPPQSVLNVTQRTTAAAFWGTERLSGGPGTDYCAASIIPS